MQDGVKPRTTPNNAEPTNGYTLDPSMADGVEVTEQQPQTASVVSAEG